MPLPTLLRLGLRQFGAGMLSVLALGILNRIMKVEMGLGLGVVGVVIGAHYFAAPLAVPVGHRSDHRPLFGRHRTPYILGGALVTSLATALTPFVALFVEAREGAPLAVLVAVLVFVLMGAGSYAAGTAYLSLLADLTPDHQRGRAVAIVWSMLMFGILAGVALGVLVLDHYSAGRLVALFLTMAAIVLALTVISIWGQERRAVTRSSDDAVTLGQALAVVADERQARLFFGFLFSGILFLFLQQAVLEPFGGDVFDMSVRQTTSFNATQMVGVLAGMGAGGGWLARRLGLRGTAGLGLVAAMVSFGLLAAASAGKQMALVQPAILLMGLGMGLFNVGGLSLMMGMSTAGRVGLYMGAWTLAQALANGMATVGGGVLYDAAFSVLDTAASAYAVVFAIEAAGLVVTLLLLRRIDPMNGTVGHAQSRPRQPAEIGVGTDRVAPDARSVLGPP